MKTSLLSEFLEYTHISFSSPSNHKILFAALRHPNRQSRCFERMNTQTDGLDSQTDCLHPDSLISQQIIKTTRLSSKPPDRLCKHLESEIDCVHRVTSCPGSKVSQMVRQTFCRQQERRSGLSNKMTRSATDGFDDRQNA